MPRIYIISRPDETIAMSDYMTELLRARYGPQNVVRGTPARTPAEYAIAVERNLRACDVAIVVMGPRWSVNPGAGGQPWFTRADDPTRIALATALRLGMLIAPVLSQGAKMPAEGNLPPDLSALLRIQGFPVRPAPDFHADMMRLYQQINTKLTWRPASGILAALAGGSGILWIALGIVGSFGKPATIILAAWSLGVLIASAAQIAAIILALTLAIRRKGWKWVWGIAVATALTLALFALPISLGVVGPVMLAAALLTFAFIGPRRETAYR